MNDLTGYVEFVGTKIFCKNLLSKSQLNMLMKEIVICH